MTNQQFYVYFVAFNVNNGCGSAFVNLVRPITTSADLEAVTQLIADGDPCTHGITITNFQLMSGPDTCGTCGK